MKKTFAALLVFAVAAVALLLVKKEKTQPNPPSPQIQSTANIQAPEPVAARSLSGNLPASKTDNSTSNQTTPNTAASPSALAESSPATNGETQTLPPLTVLDNARVAVHTYCGVFGENPVGNNAEITAALMGKNPKGINFIRADAGLNLDGNGELVDAYGTPFFFHQLSGTVMEIRSAGQDRKMWTFDDEVKR